MCGSEQKRLFIIGRYHFSEVDTYSYWPQKTATSVQYIIWFEWLNKKVYYIRFGFISYIRLFVKTLFKCEYSIKLFIHISLKYKYSYQTCKHHPACVKRRRSVISWWLMVDRLVPDILDNQRLNIYPRVKIGNQSNNFDSNIKLKPIATSR